MKKNTLLRNVSFPALVVSLPLYALSAQGIGGYTGTGGNQEPGKQEQVMVGSLGSTTLPQGQAIQEKNQERQQVQYQFYQTATSGVTAQVRDQDRDQDRLRLQDGSFVVNATSVASLRQMIQEREREFLREQAISGSTSTQHQMKTIQNQERVRGATQVLVASRGLAGLNGEKMFQIANQINAGVGTTTNAEMRIAERGRLARFFFGGDKESSAALLGELSQNRTRVQQINQLLESQSIPLQLRELLQTQVKLIEEEQNRLQILADKEQGRWGIFSWRF